jgi:hypothetical protein
MPNTALSALPHAASYVVSDDLVHDQVTGLLWERHSSSVYMTWQQAHAHCADLELGGDNEFRLPRRIELVSVLDESQLSRMDPVFVEPIADYHWTSSLASFVQGSAYTLYFGAGETTIASADPGRALVRCVAGEVLSLTPHFQVTEQGVSDRGTGLNWERQVGVASTWQVAHERCVAQQRRLPSLRELQSIVDESAHEPAIDAEVFPDTPAQAFWTGSTRGAEPWTVHFADGKTYANRSASEKLVSRCVR